MPLMNFQRTVACLLRPNRIYSDNWQYSMVILATALGHKQSVSIIPAERLLSSAYQPFASEILGAAILKVCIHPKQSFNQSIFQRIEGQQSANSGRFCTKKSPGVSGAFGVWLLATQGFLHST
jgi:hypothetical protein